MKKIWILLVIAVVLLLWRSREGLEATAKIKAPPYSNEDVKKVKDAIPQSVKDGFVAAMPNMASVPDAVKDAQMIFTIEQSLKAFYEGTYASAVAPITEGEIDVFVNGAEAAPGVPAPEGLKALIRATLKYYFIDQVVETPTGGSSLVRGRPRLGDEKLRSEVATYTALPRSDPMINTMILEMQKFYDTVYSPSKKKMPTQEEIQSFVMASTIATERKPNLTSVIDYWFTEPVMAGDYRLEGGASSEGKTSSVGSGEEGSSGGSPGSSFGGSSGPGGKLWGPPFTGTGTPRNYDGKGNRGGKIIGGDDYPTLIGPPSRGDAYWQLNDNLPGSASLGSDVLSGFLPFSRQPGDMDRIPDPYRVSQSYSPSSYSSKNEPVPFLTDFSAFQK